MTLKLTEDDIRRAIELTERASAIMREAAQYSRNLERDAEPCKDLLRDALATIEIEP
jgi:hypothetical protein